MRDYLEFTHAHQGESLGQSDHVYIMDESHAHLDPEHGYSIHVPFE